MTYELLKDYLTADGVEVPKGTMFHENTIRGSKVYTATIRSYKDENVGAVETKLHLDANRVQNSHNWFKQVGYWYINDLGEVVFDMDRTPSITKKRKAIGNYFSRQVEATAVAYGLPAYLQGKIGAFEGFKQRTNTGKVVEKTPGRYDKICATEPGQKRTVPPVQKFYNDAIDKAIWKKELEKLAEELRASGFSIVEFIVNGQKVK